MNAKKEVVEMMIDAGATPRAIARAVNNGKWVFLGTANGHPVYACDACWEQFELVTIKQPPPKCPRCGDG